MENNTNQESKKKKILLILLILLLMAAMLGVGLYLGGAFHKKQPQTAIDDTAVRYAEQQDYSEIEESPSIAIPGYDTIDFVANETHQKVVLHNPEENTCYFKMSFILSDGTKIWESDLLEPGMAFTEIELSQGLEAGTYEDVTLKYDCFSLKEMAPLNNGAIKVTLNVG